MVKVIIRDDDLNYFTKVEDLLFAYKDIPEFPVSFAVVPYVMDLSTKGACQETMGNNLPRAIDQNVELVSYIKRRIKEGSADVLLHGQSHRYIFTNNNRVPEMRQDKPYIGQSWEQAIANDKQYLEKLFNYKLRVFVAPSNTISKNNLMAVAQNGLHFSGIIPLSFERQISFINIKNYIKRWGIRLLYRMPYPGVLTYSDGHKELNATDLNRGYDYLMKMFEYCDRNNLPMAVNTHYWVLRNEDRERALLSKFIKEAIKRGGIPTKMSDCL